MRKSTIASTIVGRILGWHKSAVTKVPALTAKLERPGTWLSRRALLSNFAQDSNNHATQLLKRPVGP